MIIRDVDYQEQIDFINSLKPENSKQLLAGIWAEKQMAYELYARLGSHRELLVLNDLKLNNNGLTAQIDHLVISPYCMYLIETKSCSGTVHVNEFGEWTRNYKPITSPIEQSKRHGQILLNILNDNLDKFLGKILGIRKGLGCYQIYHYVAVSEKGQIKGNRKKFPEVMKYDLIAGKILSDYQSKHDPNPLKRLATLEDEKIRLMNDKEIKKFADFLCSINNEESLPEKFRVSVKTPVDEVSTQPVSTFLESYQGVCTKCESLKIQVYNNYGYWVNCIDCGHKEKFCAKCPSCISPLKLKKLKQSYNISCTCGFSAGYIFGAGEEVETQVKASPVCPKCKNPLTERTAKKGTNSGSKFWGCTAFPKCRYMESITS